MPTRNTRQLYWGQGLFLTPQHLQQQDLFHQGQQRYLWQMAKPHHWGIVELRVHQEGLSVNTFEVLYCECITREGVTIRAGSEASERNASLDARKFQGLLPPSGASMGVYLGLPRYRAGHPNLVSTNSRDDQNSADTDSSNQDSLNLRYRLVEQRCPDRMDVDSPEVDISLIEHNLVLLFDTEPAFANADRLYDLIKIADVAPLPSGDGVRITQTYIPPSLTISASALLMERLKTVRDLLTNRARDFESMKRQRGVRATASGLQDAVRLVMLQTLTRYIPSFHHQLEQGQLHPEAAYLLLRQLVGELSVFSEGIDVTGARSDGRDVSPVGLQPYDHERIWPLFDAAIALVKELIAGLTTGPEMGIRLEFDGEYYQADLPEDVFEGAHTRYYLMIDSLIPGDQLWATLQQTGKVSTLGDMPRLRQSALFGLKISHLPVPPEELPQRGSQYSYFAIDTTHMQWKRIRDAGNIALFSDLNAAETVIKLLLVRDE